MHNGVAGPYDISEDSVEWQQLTVKDMLMVVQRMTQVSELGYNTCLDSSKRHGPLAILNASTLRRLRHIFAERASITNDGLLRTILWVDIDEKNNFFDNFGSPTGRQAFLDEYIRWLDTWKATLQYWEKMLDERKSFPPVPDSYISYGHHTQPNLPLAHPAIQGLWQSQVWGSGYGL